MESFLSSGSSLGSVLPPIESEGRETILEREREREMLHCFWRFID